MSTPVLEAEDVVDCGVPLTALVTRPAVQTLALAPGVLVEVTFEATAVHLVRPRPAWRESPS